RRDEDLRRTASRVLRCAGWAFARGRAEFEKPHSAPRMLVQPSRAVFAAKNRPRGSPWTNLQHTAGGKCAVRVGTSVTRRDRKLSVCLPTLRHLPPRVW